MQKLVGLALIGGLAAFLAHWPGEAPKSAAIPDQVGKLLKLHQCLGIMDRTWTLDAYAEYIRDKAHVEELKDRMTLAKIKDPNLARRCAGEFKKV